MSGFDATRAPQLDLIDDCVHCGFCLPTCPTYVLWGEEMDSPRGRIVLMKQGHEEISAPLVEHLDNCLGCMACVTACPSGVQYDKLIEDARAQVERNVERPPRERAHRRLVFELFTHPGAAARGSRPGCALAQRLGLARLAAPPARAAARAAAGGAGRADARRVRCGARCARLPERFEARGERRGTVALLQGCVQRVFFGHVNEATARVLAAEGFEVHVPRLPRCCGALPLHAGEDAEARALAKATIEALEGYETVVVNAAGCGSAMKDYGHVLRDEPDWAERAGAFAAKVRDVTELLAEAEPARRAAAASRMTARLPRRLPPRPRPGRARPAARAAARRSRGSSWSSRPSGSSAAARRASTTWSSPSPPPSSGERKARNLLDTGAEAVAAAQPGLRAPDHRAHRAASAARCRCSTRWSCWRARSADPGVGWLLHLAKRSRFRRWSGSGGDAATLCGSGTGCPESRR